MLKKLEDIVWDQNYHTEHFSDLGVEEKLDACWDAIYEIHKHLKDADNRIENLEWCTAAHNVRDGFDRGRIVWNKGNASKKRIYGYCKKYPRQIFWILTNNDFQFAKAFWKETYCSCGDTEIKIGEKPCNDNEVIDWQYHLQQMVLEEDPIKYLEQFIKEK